jgi:hypothetical protein
MAKCQSYRTIARQRYRQALWITGTGPYASLASCGGLTVQLYETMAEALKAKAWIDQFGCGHACRGDQRAELHTIEDLRDECCPVFNESRETHGRS